MLLPSRRGLQPLKLALTVAAYLSLAALLYCSFGPHIVLPRYGSPAAESSQPHPPQAKGHLVPLEAHIMSKCPDAKDCLRDLVLPAMQKVHEKVNFTLSFIGKPTENDGVACMHGPGECLGNIIELCAQLLYPDPKTFLGFTMCLTRDYQEIPQRELIEDCALEHAIDFDRLNECATKDNSAFGVKLLRESVRRTAEAGVTKSCTVRLDDQVYCIRDGGKWTDCPHGPGVNDLVVAISKLYSA
ncbi:hypothetical protein VTJ83DRAFT_4171 [Remersonia thermophila]|uniref:Uncharacterized protein n=1 Tax=Remersonia thermophila TaxID=72144 RepID=A0ABR4DB99_9PEZI